MKTFIYTSISFTIIGLFLAIETVESDEVDKDISPLCRFKLCDLGSVQQSIRVAKDLELDNDSPNIDSAIEKFEELIENEKTENIENIVYDQSNIALNKKLCLFKFCASESITQKSQQEVKNYETSL